MRRFSLAFLFASLAVQATSLKCRYGSLFAAVASPRERMIALGWDEQITARLINQKLDLVYDILQSSSPEPLTVYRGIHKIGVESFDHGRFSILGLVERDDDIWVTRSLRYAIRVATAGGGYQEMLEMYGPKLSEKIIKKGLVIEYQIPHFAFVDPYTRKIIDAGKTDANGIFTGDVVQNNQIPFINRFGSIDSDLADQNYADRGYAGDPSLINTWTRSNVQNQ
jgi:hypothetical protein